jgi:hypothetical protein
MVILHFELTEARDDQRNDPHAELLCARECESPAALEYASRARLVNRSGKVYVSTNVTRLKIVRLRNAR